MEPLTASTNTTLSLNHHHLLPALWQYLPTITFNLTFCFPHAARTRRMSGHSSTKALLCFLMTPCIPGTLSWRSSGTARHGFLSQIPHYEDSEFFLPTTWASTLFFNMECQGPGMQNKEGQKVANKEVFWQKKQKQAVKGFSFPTGEVLQWVFCSLIHTFSSTVNAADNSGRLFVIHIGCSSSWFISTATRVKLKDILLPVKAVHNAIMLCNEKW